MKKRFFGKSLSAVGAALIALSLLAVPVLAECPSGMEETGTAARITAVGIYANWDGVTNVAQFADAKGNLCYAVNSDSVVTVYQTDPTNAVPKPIKLTKQHPLFGTALCDKDGNFYLVTGEENKTDDTTVETVFISKYSSDGKLIRTTGDNGSSSLASYYDSSYYTQIPFSAGNCDAAIFGDILTVNYARKMYSGHQSNSVFSVNINDMSKVNGIQFYESHSFAQRVVPTKEGFVYMSEGDCYDRSFTAYCVKLSDGSVKYRSEAAVFDFWVEDGAYDTYNMYVVNENFAHMGGLAALSNGKVAFAAQSAQSLSENAKSEKEEIFLQIFDPYKPLNTPESFVTEGTRSGLAGKNGRTEVTNYGVKWLTASAENAQISNVQVVASDNDEIVVLYEYTEGSVYKGVYYIVLDVNGNVICPATLFSESAMLNPCEMPVCSNRVVRWVANKKNDSGNRIYLYTLSLSEEEHDYSLWKTTKEATCAEEGSESLCCSVCGVIKPDSARAIPKTEEHQWDNGTVTKPATEKAAGIKTYKCKRCGTSRTEPIPKVVLKKNPLKVKVSSITYKRAYLTKARTFKIGVTKAKGKVTYTLNKKAKKAKIKVSKKGKVTIPRNCKPGIYKITVKAGKTNEYKAGKKTVTIKVKK